MLYQECSLNEAKIYFFTKWLCLVCAMRADNYTEEEIKEILSPIVIVDKTQ